MYKGMFPSLLPFKSGKCFLVCSWTNVLILCKVATLATERQHRQIEQDKGLLTWRSL